MRFMTGKNLSIVITALLLCSVLSGCELLELFGGESEQQQVEEVAQEWVDENDMSPVNQDGTINTDGAVKAAKRAVTGSTGDPEVDAALASDQAIIKIAEADKLVERGWEQNNAYDFDNAVRLRPEDWTYRISRAAWNMDYFVSPNMNQVDADLAAAENMLGPSKDERIRYAQQGIALLERVKTTMAKPYASGEQADLWKKSRECRTVFSRLAHFNHVMADQTGQPDYRQVAQQYERDLGACP